MEERGEVDSTAQLRGGRQGQLHGGECVCVFVHAMYFVHMLDSSVDVSVLHSFAAEVNQQVQVYCVVTCCYR